MAVKSQTELNPGGVADSTAPRHNKFQEELTMRFASIIVVLLALATLATAGTVTETFNSHYSPFPGGYNNGWNSTRTTVDNNTGSYSYLDWAGAPWFNPNNPWFSNWSSTSTSNNVSNYDSTTFNQDGSGNAGIGPYAFNSVTDTTNVYLNNVLYPLQNLVHVDGQKYNTRDTILSMGIYSFDCRDLVNAGLSGACAGSDVGLRKTTNIGLGGIWFGFDIDMNTGSMFNYKRGDINPWKYENLEIWNRSWDSQPFNGSLPSEVPEPGTYAMMGLGLAALGLLHRRK